MTLTTRRAALLGLCALPTLALAHGGHGRASIRASAKITRNRNDKLRLKISILNLSSKAMVFDSMQVDGAEIETKPGRAPLPGFGALDVTCDLHFAQGTPERFTLTLDFGQDGQEHLQIVP